jgi:uncharacterized protein (AIM24 family)
MRTGRLNYKVFLFSESTQIIQMVLDPGQTISAGAAFDKWLDDGIIHETTADQTENPDQGVIGKLLDSRKQKLGRHHHQVIYYTNASRVSKTIAFAAPVARQILPIHLYRNDGNFFCHKEAFFCAESGIEMISDSGIKLKSNLLGMGQSDWLEFRGDGILFVHVGGTFKNKQLKNQSLKLDRRSIVGFAAGITSDQRIASVSRLNRSDTKAYFQVKLSGSGTVYLQSKPFKMPKHAQSLTRDISELLNTRAFQLYKGNLEKIKNFQWSTLPDLINKENLQNTLQRKIVLPRMIRKLTGKKRL